MKMHLLMTATALAMGLASPAMAQQSMHRYVALFKYSDSAVKAMMENPQDRSAQGTRNPAESFGGKMVAAFFFPGGGEFDGMVINEHPDDVTAAARVFSSEPRATLPKS